MDSIAKIISKYNKSGKQKYSDFYSRHLKNLNPKVLLEIGVSEGESLRIWEEVFPNCKVHGIDINTDALSLSPDLSIFIGDQRDKIFINNTIMS